MAIKPPFTITKKYSKFTAHITITNFDANKHPDIFNCKLAEILVNKANSTANENYK